jgi:hypothetical protein
MRSPATSFSHVAINQGVFAIGRCRISISNLPIIKHMRHSAWHNHVSSPGIYFPQVAEGIENRKVVPSPAFGIHIPGLRLGLDVVVAVIVSASGIYIKYGSNWNLICKISIQPGDEIFFFGLMLALAKPGSHHIATVFHKSFSGNVQFTHWVASACCSADSGNTGS